MPITQRRMLKLLEAAESLILIIDGLQHDILHQSTLISQRQTTYEEAYKYMELSIAAASPNATTATIIGVERERYRLTYLENLKQKAKQQERRTNAGILPRVKQPTYLDPTERPKLYPDFSKLPTQSQSKPQHYNEITPEESERMNTEWRARMQQEELRRNQNQKQSPVSKLAAEIEETDNNPDDIEGILQ